MRLSGTYIYWLYTVTPYTIDEIIFFNIIINLIGIIMLLGNILPLWRGQYFLYCWKHSGLVGSPIQSDLFYSKYYAAIFGIYYSYTYAYAYVPFRTLSWLFGFGWPHITRFRSACQPNHPVLLLDYILIIMIATLLYTTSIAIIAVARARVPLLARILKNQQ